MEVGEGAIAAVVADDESVSSSPPLDSDSSPVGSPENAALEAREPPSDDDGDVVDGSDHASEIAVSVDDLKKKIVRQVEYYFSDENLPTDKYMLSLIKNNKGGFVPVGIIASFRKMKKLTRDHSVIVAALKESSMLVVSSNGKKVKRVNPLPFTEVKDPKLCTVLVENLPEDHSEENIQRIFGKAGNIKNICFHDPNAADESKKDSKAEMMVSGKVQKHKFQRMKSGVLALTGDVTQPLRTFLSTLNDEQWTLSRLQLYALVEYETVQAAEIAASTLNNEQDWRNGMRVKLLSRVGKYVRQRPAWKGHDSDKNGVGSNGPSSEQAGGDELENHNIEHHDDTPDEEGGDHPLREKNGHRGQNRGRSRRNTKYRGAHGLGHGTTLPTHSVEHHKPPPGPRMPDGTRGFTMGRGRPLVSEQS